MEYTATSFAEHCNECSTTWYAGHDVDVTHFEESRYLVARSPTGAR